MSTIIMAQCWPLQMPPVAKAVLMSLADNANDHGVCWPSITTICERTCFGRTAVIAAIKELEQIGLLEADRTNGRHTTYKIHPGAMAKTTANQSATRTGTSPEPVRETDLTSPPRGPDPSARRTLTAKNRKEPSYAVTRAPESPTAAGSFEGHDDPPDATGATATAPPSPPPSTPAAVVRPPPAAGLPMHVAAAIALRDLGMRITSSHPDLIAAGAEGVTVAQVVEAARTYPDKPPTYAIAVARRIAAAPPSPITASTGAAHDHDRRSGSRRPSLAERVREHERRVHAEARRAAGFEDGDAVAPDDRHLRAPLDGSARRIA